MGCGRRRRVSCEPLAYCPREGTRHAVTSALSENDQIVRAAALAMGLSAWVVILPLSIASLVSGRVQALSTAWGLLQHYWILFKLLLTALAKPQGRLGVAPAPRWPKTFGFILGGVILPFAMMAIFGAHGPGAH